MYFAYNNTLTTEDPYSKGSMDTSWIDPSKQSTLYFWSSTDKTSTNTFFDQYTKFDMNGNQLEYINSLVDIEQKVDANNKTYYTFGTNTLSGEYHKLGYKDMYEDMKTSYYIALPWTLAENYDIVLAPEGTHSGEISMSIGMSSPFSNDYVNNTIIQAPNGLTIIDPDHVVTSANRNNTNFLYIRLDADLTLDNTQNLSVWLVSADSYDDLTSNSNGIDVDLTTDTSARTNGYYVVSRMYFDISYTHTIPNYYDPEGAKTIYGLGTEENPYQIYSWDQIAFLNYYRDCSSENNYYMLMNDITITDSITFYLYDSLYGSYTQVTRSGKGQGGYLDNMILLGNGHTINVNSSIPTMFDDISLTDSKAIFYDINIVVNVNKLVAPILSENEENIYLYNVNVTSNNTVKMDYIGAEDNEKMALLVSNGNNIFMQNCVIDMDISIYIRW